MKLFNAAGTRRIDELATSELRIASTELMERAGGAAWNAIHERWPEATRLVVVCGAGNNAGDGYVVARVAAASGLAVDVVQALPPAALKGDAARNFERLQATTVRIHETTTLPEDLLTPGTVLVDALFGTGLTRPIEGDLAALITAQNRARVPRFAIDLPSGIDADTGAVLGAAFDADLTLTFIAHKVGLHTGSGCAHAGKLAFDDLGVSQRLYEDVDARALGYAYETLASLFTPRRRDSHKGDFGHVLVIGGYEGMGGAALMAAEAAARCGAGLVSVATWPGHAASFITRCPALMARPVAAAEELPELVERATILALGPGLGRAPWGAHLFQAAVDSDLPMVLDADALNFLAEEPTDNARWILTPHPGEAGRLLGVPTAEVQRDRLGAAEAIADRYGGVCVLKGAGTVVAGASGTAVCLDGNPGMASGGMGDVLTGVIAGIAAQRDLDLSLASAARAGVAVHARAGDRAASRIGPRGLVAPDLLTVLPALVSRLGA